MKQFMEKKALLALMLICLIAPALVFAGGGQEGETEETAEPAATMTDGTYNEAPMLAEMVAAGELPPVDERLPAEPLVVTPKEQIGEYGGTWNRVWLGSADSPAYTTVIYEPLIRYSEDLSSFQPNIATDWEISDDATSITITIREGIKWSDGEPFTTEDIAFWLEVMQNEDLYPGESDIDTHQIEIIDDYTFRYIWPEPYAMILTYFAQGQWDGPNPMNMPKHWLEQYVTPYTPLEDLEEMAREAGYDDYPSWFDAVDTVFNPERPVLYPWKVTSPLGEQRITSERNPYFWQVDTEGNQLPYIDNLVHDYVERREIASARIATGEVDFQGRHLAQSDWALARENEVAGNLKLYALQNPNGSARVAMNVNQTYVGEDADKWVPLLRTPEFRYALSLALNRDEVSTILTNGIAPGRQTTLNELSPYFKPEWAEAYAEYDPGEAERLLDEIGVTRSSGGWRTFPDGSELNLVLSAFGASGERVDAAELISGYLEDIGINTTVRAEERSLWVQRRASGDHTVSVYAVTGGFEPFAGYIWWVPTVESLAWAPRWGLWYQTNGAQGEEPTNPDVLRLYEIYEEALTLPTVDERRPLVEEMMEIHAENIWYIGLYNYYDAITVAGADTVNSGPWAASNEAGGIGIQRPAQFSFVNPQ